MENLVHKLFVFLAETFGANHNETCTLCRIHEPNHVPETSPSLLQSMPLYYHSGKYKLSIRFFLEYCYTIVPLHYNISCTSKGYLVHDRNVHKKFGALLNSTITCIVPFTCNNNFSISLLNEILFLHSLNISF